MNLTDSSWYCLRTHPKHETVAAAHLRQIPSVSVFNPQVVLMRWTRRGWMRRCEPLFPNYLFARFTLETTLEKVRYTPAVKNVLEFGGRAPVIPDGVMEELHQTMQLSASQVFTEAPEVGQEVEITRGPFEGLSGRVVWVRPAKDRVKILLDILGNSVPAELSLECVLYGKTQAAEAVLNGLKPLPPVKPTMFSWTAMEQRSAA